jgi:hypothetical protein
MAVSFPPNLSPAVQAASIQEYRNAAASQTAPLRYPQKSIGKDDDYLEIGVIKYVPPGFETGKNNLKLKTGTEKNSNKKANIQYNYQFRQILVIPTRLIGVMIV